MDDNEKDPELFISQIGKNISKDTIDTLMKQCLLLAVPDTKSGRYIYIFSDFKFLKDYY